MEQKPTREKVVPRCRYEHGELKHLTGAEYGQGFSGFGFQSVRSVPGEEAKSSLIAPLPRGIVLQAYECPVCGYTELFGKTQE